MSGNFTAYQGIESLSNYPTRESLVDYRTGRLVRYAKVVELIRAESAGQLPVSVAEIGSGSSALLYALSRERLLKAALGIELSGSRHEFAERWKADDGYSAVENVHASFTDVDLGVERWDWVLVIDNTFTYLHPEDPTYPDLLLDAAWESLRGGGRVLLDFINYAKSPMGTDRRTWAAFAPTDPFAYGLYSIKTSDGLNKTESIFIKRDGSEARKMEKSKVYSLRDITSLLQSHGFTVDRVWATFDAEPYVEMHSERLVVVATKAG